MKSRDIAKLTATVYSTEIKYITWLLVLVSWSSSAIYSSITNTVPLFIGRRQAPLAYELELKILLQVT